MSSLPSLSQAKTAKMLYRTAVTAAALLAPSTWAAPAPAPAPEPARVEKWQNGHSSAPGTYGATNLPTEMATTPSGSSGQLRGSPELAGYNPGFPVNMQPDEAVVPTASYSLVPGQTANPTLLHVQPKPTAHPRRRRRLAYRPRTMEPAN